MVTTVYRGVVNMLERIKEMICEFISVDADTITADSKLRSEIGLNSFDIVNVAVEIEKEYGVSIPDRTLNSMKTVGDLINYIKANK